MSPQRWLPARSTVHAVGPLFGSGAGLDDRGVATLMSMIILGGALLQWPIGLLSDRHDRRLVIAIVAALAASAALLVFLTAGISRPALLPSAALFGGFAFSIYALGVAHTSDQLSPQQVLGAMRGLLLLNGIGATLGPLLASTMMSWLGHRSLMVYMAAILSLLMVVALVRITTSRPVPEEEKGEFVAMARTSPVALELDPRAELELGVPRERAIEPGETFTVTIQRWLLSGARKSA